MTIVVALLFGMALPVTAVQILWINLITGITLGIALAFEPTEDNTMRRPPRPRNEPLLDAGLVWHIVSSSPCWEAVRGTKVVWLTVIVITAAQFAITYLAPLQRVFGTQAIPFFVPVQRRT